MRRVNNCKNFKDCSNIRGIAAGDFFFLIGLIGIAFSVYFPYLKYPIREINLFYLSSLSSVLSLALKHNSAIRVRLVDLIFVAILFTSIAGLAYSSNFSVGIQYLMTLTIMWLIHIIVRSSDRYLSWLLYCLVVCSVVNAVSLLLEKINPNFFFRIASLIMKQEAITAAFVALQKRAYAGIGGYTNVSSYLVSIVFALAFIAFLGAMQSRKEHKRLLALFLYGSLLVVSLYAIIISNKRGILLATLVAAFTCYLFFVHNHKRVLIRSLLIVALMIIVCWVVLRYNEFAQNLWHRFFSNEGDFTSSRFQIYQDTINNWQNWVAFGNGTGSAFDKANVLGVGGGVHNIYIQIFYDHGMLGEFLYLIWFAINFNTTIYSINCSKYDFWNYASMAVQIIFLIYGFVGNPIYEYYELFPYMVFSAIPYLYLRKRCVDENWNFDLPSRNQLWCTFSNNIPLSYDQNIRRKC